MCLKIRRKHLSKRNNLNADIEEWYLLGFLLTGDKVLTDRLITRTVNQVKDKFISIRLDHFVLKPLIKEYKKYYRNHDIIYQPIDASPLLNRLGLLNEQARIAFLLKYYYDYSYKKIANHLGISERKAKTVIYDGLTIWTNNGKFVSVNNIDGVLKKEILLIKSKWIENVTPDNRNQVLVMGTKGRHKLPGLLLILLILVAGGSINQEILSKTRVSLGPDIYKYFKEGGVLQINQDIKDKGFGDIYTIPDSETKTIEVYFPTPERLGEKEEVAALIESYLENRDLEYQLEFQVLDQLEVELTDEQKDANKVMEMEQEIFELVSENPYYYMQRGTSEQSGESTEILLSEEISVEEEEILKEEIENIIHKHNLEWNFSFGKVSADVVDMERAKWDIYLAIIEAFFFGENKYKLYDVYSEYINGVMEFNVYTELSLTTEKDADETEEIIKELRRSLQFFLEHEDIQDLMNNVPYVIKIHGENREEI